MSDRKIISRYTIYKDLQGTRRRYDGVVAAFIAGAQGFVASDLPLDERIPASAREFAGFVAI